jgi:hypothetical protein
MTVQGNFEVHWHEYNDWRSVITSLRTKTGFFNASSLKTFIVGSPEKVTGGQLSNEQQNKVVF